MDLDTAIEGMIKTRAALRSTKGVVDPSFISEQMQRLAQYTGAVEEYLGDYEKKLETDETKIFFKYTKDRSINQAEKLAKYEVGETKGQVAKLKRYANSSWSIIGVAQSRVNHLASEYKAGGKVT